jgi:hypothetical protein
MDLVNPFEPVGKAAATPPQSAKVIRALVPTGRHVGHGQDLKVARGPKSPASGTLLEHYRGKKTKQVPGPFGKSVERGLAQIAHYTPSAVPKAQMQSGKVAGAGMMQGRRAGMRGQGALELNARNLHFKNAWERDQAMGKLRNVARGRGRFQDASSSGRRIG